MNCRQATIWLLHADDVRLAPADVAAHLAECRRCRRRGARLRRLQHAVAALPVPAADLAVRKRVLERIAEPLAPAAVIPARPRRWRALLARAAMILLLVGGFSVLAMNLANPDPANRAPGLESEFIGQLVQCHLRLAQGAPPEERCRAFAEMGKDLRKEALRLAWQRETTDLAALAALYDRVIREGVLSHVAKLPPDQRRPLAAKLVDELRQTELEATHAADSLAPAAAALRDIAATARAAHAQLDTLRGEKSL